MAYHRFPKLGLVADCEHHLILSTLGTQGPAPDVDELAPLLRNMCGNVLFDQLLLDAGYDSEPNHELLREHFGVESIIPPKAGRPTDKLPAGKYRFLMTIDFDDEAYGQRARLSSPKFGRPRR